MTCPNCERYKQSASVWRNKAYELSGTPLPWKPDELWVGLTDEERAEFDKWVLNGMVGVAHAIEAKLREKNG